MGEGGTLVLINATPYTWKQTNHHSSQMNTWSFPDSVAPKSATGVYVEWDQSIFVKESLDGGEVYFALEGTSNTFQIQARAPSSNFNLQAYFDGIATSNNPQGSTISLGWSHNGHTPFILSGSTGAFWSNSPSPGWMQGLLPIIGNKPIRHICIPGSHDAGMYTITGGTAFGIAENCQTQTKSIGDQLTLGSRYFDIRPIITGGKYGTGHYSNTNVDGITWQGANGENFDDIISQINAFTSKYNELIVLNLSHDYNTDTGRDYRHFTQDEMNALLEKLTAINHLYVASDPYADLTTLSLNDFIGKGQPAVAVVVQPGASSIDTYLGKGFYTYDSFNAYNNYSNSDSLSYMTSNQLDLMHQYKASPDDQLFLLSWTLTQQPSDMVKDTSILDLASEADDALYLQVFPASSANSLPNILYVDKFDSSDITALAIAINHAYASQTANKQRRAMHKKRFAAPAAYTVS